MKFYVDFEAVQFSGRIISIGCVCENGNTFSTLCKPSKEDERVNAFITNLTGITNEMLAEAPPANTAFMMFYSWVVSQSDGTVPEYYFFGNTDAQFITNTVKYMTDISAITFAMSIKALMKDFAPTCAQHFGLKNVGLKRVYNMLKMEEEEQKHDALEDAMMLMYVQEHLNDVEPAEAVLPPAQHNKNTKKAPAIFNEWPNKPADKFKADTGDISNWVVAAKSSENSAMKYFDSMDKAVLWAIKYLTKGRSPKKEKDLNTTKNAITQSNMNNNKVYGFYWIIKEEKKEDETECTVDM